MDNSDREVFNVIFSIIQCNCQNVACVSKMVGLRVKGSEIWDLGTLAINTVKQ